MHPLRGLAGNTYGCWFRRNGDHQLICKISPLFIGFLYIPRWLEMRFLNHQWCIRIRFYVKLWRCVGLVNIQPTPLGKNTRFKHLPQPTSFPAKSHSLQVVSNVSCRQAPTTTTPLQGSDLHELNATTNTKLTYSRTRRWRKFQKGKNI